MNPDITRSTFDPSRHYTSVRLQQGRILLDADWNEQVDIDAHYQRQYLRDVIGPHGALKDTDSFRVEMLDDGTVQDLAVHPGRYYVDGLICELEPESVDVVAFEAAQRVLLERVRLDDRPFEEKHWVRLSDGTTERTVRVDEVDGLRLVLATTENLQMLFGAAAVTLRRVTTYGTQPHYPLPSDGSQDLATLLADVSARFVMYLDVWERPVSGVENASLVDEALAGADTATRRQLVWQLRIEETTADTCDDLGSAWRPETTDRGRLRARAVATAAPSDPCIIPEEGGYRRLENQLYRVEIHDDGAPGAATFLWSRDNAARSARVREVDGITVRVAPPGRDVLAKLTTKWIELTDTPRVLRGEPGHLAQVDDVSGDTLTLSSPVPAGLLDPENRTTFLRRWDSQGASTLSTGAFVDIEGGLQVEFDEGTYETGDFWLIPARAATGRILWPSENGTAVFENRHGTEHAFAPLALLRHDGGTFAPADCRHSFPPLTDIDADDVAFDDTTCGLGAETVQAAIEALCERPQEACTITLHPGPSWADSLDDIAPDTDLQLCFRAGDFPVTEPIILRDLGEVKVSGYGPGSRLLASTTETAVRFENCASVLVRDLYAEGAAVGSSGTGRDGLNGALTFRGCGAVHVEAVTAKCASGARRGAACLTIDGTPLEEGDPNAGIVRVRHCDLRVGHQQVGLLILNARRTHVQDNVIRVGRKPRSLGLEQLLQDKHYRAGVRNLMIARGRTTDDEEFVGSIPDNLVVFTVRTGNRSFSITFETDPQLQSVWERYSRWHSPEGIQSERDLFAFLENVADQVLLGQGALQRGNRTFTDFRSWYRRLQQSNAAAAGQGIVVAGIEGRETRILDNTVYGALQGIHLGLDANTSVRETFGTVRIQGNTVQVFLTPFARGRHGMFVGNCDSLSIEDNYIRVRRYPVTNHLEIDGIRVEGVLGMKCMLDRNHVVGAGPGIRATALAGTPRAGLRAIRDNVLESLLSGSSAVQVQGKTFRVSDNEEA